MISTALKNLASQYRLATNKSMVYGYLQGSFVALMEGPFHRRMSIYVGSVNVTLPDGETRSPAAQCTDFIIEMVDKATAEENIYHLIRNRLMPALAVNQNGSVVTINFARTRAGLNGLQRFIAEMLPRITPYTAPLQCAHCGSHTGGQGYPVAISADTAVPMHADCLKKCIGLYTSTHHTVAAMVGSALGALLGATGCAVFVHAGLPFALGALLILMLTIGSYHLLHGAPGQVRLTALTISITGAVLAATLGIHCLKLHSNYLAYGSVVSGMLSESMYFRIAAKNLLASPATWFELLFNLSITFMMALILCIGRLKSYKGCASIDKPKAMPGQA